MNFKNYNQQVEFDGIEISLCLGYRYISRDVDGTLCAWREKPCWNEFGFHSNNNNSLEYPIILGRQITLGDITPLLKKYRRRDHAQVFTLTGCNVDF